ATASQDGELVLITGTKFREWLTKEKASAQTLLLGLLKNAMTRLHHTSNELSVVYGVGRMLGSPKSIAENVSEALDFLKASSDHIESITLYRRNPFAEEYEPWVTIPDSAAKPETLPLDHPLVEEVRAAEHAIVSKAKPAPAIALVPLIDPDAEK